MEEIRGESALIVGFGREGKSVLSWLRLHYPQLRVGVADRNVAPGYISGETKDGVTVYNGEGYLSHLAEYDTVIRSPGVSPYLPELIAYKKGNGHVTSATNIFFSRVSGMTVGVTGTKGKSTTSSLIAQLLKFHYTDVRLVGNIGIPMLDSLDTATPKTVFVMELSSHQLYDCRYSPHIAVMLGIVSEHLDYYPDLMSYARAKANIAAYQTKDDVLIYNPAHTVLTTIATPYSAKKVTYGLDAEAHDDCTITDGIITLRKKDKSIPVIAMANIPLLGNQENVLAAVTVAWVLGISPTVIAEAITPFQSLPHRLEYVGEFLGISFYNDSLATIPQATMHALSALGPDAVTLIAGGYDRHLDFADLGAYLRKHPIKNLILFPDTGEKIWSAIGQVQEGTIRKFMVNTMKEAVRLAYDTTPHGAICVLSPGSASYNLFRDYADRGDQFKHWVRTFGGDK
jgi:UDP-N-acetylmuramoylalanine--D-glutamate ligase